MINKDQLYEKQIGAAYWFVKNKFLLKTILTVFLIVLIILLVAYFLFLIIFNLVIQQDNYQAGLTNLVNANPDYTVIRQLGLPQEIQAGQINTFTNMQGFDIVSEIVNPNETWWATFSYQFQIGPNLTDKRRGFILPGETKKIIDLAVDNGNLSSGIVFSNINWQKEINFIDIFQSRFKFDIKNIQYIPARELGIGDEIPISRIVFEVTNDSAYNYKDVNFLVFLKAGEQVAAINQIVTDKILSGATKKVEVTFFQPLPRITSVDINAEVNILDETVYLKF